MPSLDVCSSGIMPLYFLINKVKTISGDFLKYIFHAVETILTYFREMMDLLERIIFTMECTSERFLSSFKKLH